MSEVAELSPSHADPVPVGAILGGRYELRRVLGRGAAAVVFAAEHVLVRRQVAIKVPLVDIELREMLSARLRRETEALAQIRHPAIVDVIDAGEHEGLPFLAMQLLEGRTLSGLIAARGRLSPEETIKIGIGLAGGLTAVHEAGFIHRDVKPSNVQVTRSPHNQVHLFDFGIVKLKGAKSEVIDRKLTQSGSILGTPEYMPLEAFLGNGEIDPRLDIYALGITLFECLTGAVPVEGSLAQILLRLSTKQLPAIADIRSDVPAALAATVTRCLASDASARFASMLEVSAALRGCAHKPLDSIDLLRAAATMSVPTATALGTFATTATLPLPEARRGHVRAPYLTPATLQREGAVGATAARIEDLSEGGVLLLTEGSYAAAEKVKLRFSLPISGRVISLSATVRWTRKARGNPATGLEFNALPDPAREEIRKYVSLMTRQRS